MVNEAEPLGRVPVLGAALTVGANGSTPVSWPVDSNGYYDVIITANTSDGFTRRYAGRIA